MGPTFAGLALGLMILAAVLWPLERLRPAVPTQRWWRRGSRTDLLYWFFTPLVTRGVSRVALGVGVLLLAASAGVPLDRPHVAAFVASSRGWVSGQPVWLQVVEVLLIGDLIGYWTHRLFHGRRLWPFHAVHHSSTEVDWLSAVRLHPVNDVVSRASQALPLLVLGFPAGVLAGYVPFLSFYALLLHANVPWTFGPLRHLLASPAFHRWHHTTEAEGLDKNFAGLFPFIDRAFATLYLPPGRQPAVFGVEGTPVPDGLWGQLAYPFRRAGAGPAVARQEPV